MISRWYQRRACLYEPSPRPNLDHLLPELRDDAEYVEYRRLCEIYGEENVDGHDPQFGDDLNRRVRFEN